MAASPVPAPAAARSTTFNQGKLSVRPFLEADWESLAASLPKLLPYEPEYPLAVVLSQSFFGEPKFPWEFWMVSQDKKPSGFLGYQIREADVCVRYQTLLPDLRNPYDFRILLSFVRDRWPSKRLTVLVRESDLQSQIFLRTLGVRCVATHRRFFRCEHSTRHGHATLARRGHSAAEKADREGGRRLEPQRPVDPAIPIPGAEVREDCYVFRCRAADARDASAPAPTNHTATP